MKDDAPRLLFRSYAAVRRFSIGMFLASFVFGLLVGCGQAKVGRESAAKDGVRQKIDFEESSSRRLYLAPPGAEPVERRVEAGAHKAENQSIENASPVPPKEKPRTPKVWHRDASRPTVARVYIGDKNTLELVSLQVSVVIEGPRARTLVDHVFRNPHDRQLEGTFEYPLPAGASPSYYAMFLGQTRDAVAPRFHPPTATSGKKPLAPESLSPALLARQVDAADWGPLQEARIVAPDRAVEAYEEVVRGRVDPALLEYASGNTFRGRVFPIAPKGYNRVLLAYEETLSVAENRLLYRFNLPTQPLHELRFSLQANSRSCQDMTFLPNDARKEVADTLVSFTRTWSETTPRGEVVFSARPANPRVQATSGRQREDGPLYFYARLRPELPPIAREEPFAKHAVVMLDTSLSEGRDRFGVSLKLLQAILEGDRGIEHFNILAFNAAAAWVDPQGWLPNTPAGRQTALARLDGLLLEGATNLSAALDKLMEPGFPMEPGTPLTCFLLSDGHLTWGQTEVAPLTARFRKRCPHPVRFFCYRTGLGEENAELYEALTRDGGGVFHCFGEPEVVAAATAHRRQCLQIERIHFADAPDVAEVLVAGRRSAVYPGGELIVAGQVKKPGESQLVIEGRFQGQHFSQTFPLLVGADGELAPRAWGETAVASLLALNDPWVDDLVTAYCQEFNIASRAASFLVLEDEAMYRRFALDKEKAKTVKGDLGRYLDDAWTLLAKETSVKQAFGRLLFQIDARTRVLSGSGGGEVKQLLELLSEADCTMPAGAVQGAILREKEADKDYLQARKEADAVHPYLQECQRRYNEGDVDGAVRVLSSIIEQHPSRGDALRLVGYRLLDMHQPGLAAQLFAQVLRQRPFEPHSFRDLARSLEDARHYPLAALLYESVLAGEWHTRFGPAIKTVTREEHARLLRTAVREGSLTPGQRLFFEKRLHTLAGSEQTADLRVSITWNTDATDVDLWVIEPTGFKVFYGAQHSPSGGQLSQDQTQGYGPERYHIATARKGEYQILVHYFAANRNLLGGETHVNVVIARHAGTPREKVERRTIILHRQGEQATVARIRF